MFLTKNKRVTYVPGRAAVRGRPAYTYCRPVYSGGGGGSGGGTGGGGANCRVVCVPVTVPDPLVIGGVINGQRCDTVCG